MAQQIVLFAALLFVALGAGVAFVVSLVYNPAGVSAMFYVEEMQHAIRVLTIPLPTVVTLGVFFTIISTFLGRSDRLFFYLLLAASVCVIAVALITVLGNIPINNQIMTWSANAPPSNWTELGEKWFRFQIERTILQIAGLALLIVAALRR